MLKELHIQNLILVEKATLSFSCGLSVFSGETGSGKTAILHALNLVLGMRTDASIIRHGQEKATTTANFELLKNSPVFIALNEAGVEISDDEDLVIKREITSLGKSKAFINNQQVQSSLLKQIAPFLIDIVQQHASQKLFETAYHRQILDQFGNYPKLLEETAQAYFDLENLKSQLQILDERIQNENLLKTSWQTAYQEISEAKLIHPQEEDILFEEYEKLSKSKELFDVLNFSYETLVEHDSAVMSTLKSLLLQLKKMKLSYLEFNNLIEQFENSIEQLNETTFSIRKFKDSLEENPERLFEINERLKLLKSLCKKFGPTLEEVIKKREEFQAKLLHCENSDDLKKGLLDKIHQLKTLLSTLCQKLSQERKKAKTTLEEQVQKVLAQLHFSNAELIIELTPCPISQYGQEKVEFFLLANKGEKKVPLNEGVSGGELSRVLLALKVILSELEETPTIVFDEIDANLGGLAAPKIGKLLKNISQSKQVFVITHLPQVAMFADHHFLVNKVEENARTISIISLLNQKQKEKEMERMLGGKIISDKASELAQDLVQTSKETK